MRSTNATELGDGGVSPKMRNSSERQMGVYLGLENCSLGSTESGCSCSRVRAGGFYEEKEGGAII